MDHSQLMALAKELAKNLKTDADLNEFSKALKMLTVETALNAELTEHLGHEHHQASVHGNACNGYSKKQLLTSNEGAKFWLFVLTELKNRGVQDILIACVDGLKGFPDAITAVYPQTWIQLCIIHMVRNSLRYVSWKDYKAIMSDLKRIYQSTTEEAALQALEAFASTWDDKYPQISKSWYAHWQNLNTLFAYLADIRKAIYTTNAIESLNSVIRQAIKKRKLFPTDDSVRKVIYLAIEAASKKWNMPIRDWRAAMNWFMIEFENRLDAFI